MKQIKKNNTVMASHIISYKGEMLNLDNVIYAKPMSDTCIHLELVGSAGAGDETTYSIQHRRMNLYWPIEVWNDLCKKAGIIFTNVNTTDDKD